MRNDDTDKTNPAETEGLDISEYIPGHDLKDTPDGRPAKGAPLSWDDWPADVPARKDRTEHPFNLVLNIVVLPFLLIGLMVPWAFGLMMIWSVHRDFYFAVWTVFMLGVFVLICGNMFHSRALRRISYAMMLFFLVSTCVFRAWTWWTVDRYPVVKEVDWRQYRPFEEGNKLVKVEIPAEYALDAKNSYPRLDGAYALYPIYAAMAQGMYPEFLATNRQFLCTDGSDYVYGRLLNGGSDLVFALAPSKNQQEDAEKAGVKYELTPFCKDAFVFYVNAKNPVDNLTTEQIKGIYSGKITDWKEVGAPFSTKIIPFQRNEGSGSQTTLQKLMGDTPIMPPLKEDRLGGMGDIINDTANYRNYRASLGFSFRYYSTELLRNDQIKLLSIDGVAPTVENIRNGTYPLVATAYMVTKDSPRPANVQKIIDFMLSPEGQRLVEETGYVPVGPASEE